jgi:hypothetical protein
MVMNVLKELVGSAYIAHHMMEAIVSGQIVCADDLDFRVA